ncbi:PIR Superfamily Protein, partial [Plasmodium malariae]
MTSDTTQENENTVTLYVKYKSEFEKVILDTQNERGKENPAKKCMTISLSDNDLVSACQEVGRYLIEINENYKSDSLKRCKYLNYRINSDNNYNKKTEWFQKYNEFSSQLGNICVQKFEEIQSNILNKLKQLYSYYDNFENFNGQESDSDGTICKNIKECYNFYNDNYKACQGNNESLICKELINFKKAYDDKMNKLSPCHGLPQTLPQIEQTSIQILQPKEVDYVSVPILTTSIVLLMSFTIFFLYKHIKIIFLNKLKQLYSYYDNFENFNGQESDSD